MRMRQIFSLVAVMALMTGVAAADNSLAVNATAAMNGTSYGLQLVLEDPASSTPDSAYVMAGPDKGFNNETTLKGSFFINPRNLVMSDAIGQNYFQLMQLYEGLVDNSDVKVIFFLHRDDSSGYWFITAWHWNESVANWVFSGNGFFALYADDYFATTKIDFEWTQGAPGNLKMWRTLYHGSTPDATGKILMFDVPLPGQSDATVNYVFAGMLNYLSHLPGTHGWVGLDEFVFTR